MHKKSCKCPVCDKAKTIQRFIQRFQAKPNADRNEYLLMQTKNFTWILSPVRASQNNERIVIWQI